MAIVVHCNLTYGVRGGAEVFYPSGANVVQMIIIIIVVIIIIIIIISIIIYYCYYYYDYTNILKLNLFSGFATKYEIRQQSQENSVR